MEAKVNRRKCNEVISTGELESIMKKSIYNNLVLILVSGIIGIFCTSCSTVNGFGRDVEKTGDKISEAAQR